ncbi:hypothetical protein C922_04999 [Plasmodium inui San Antonio 1]|uniref:Uncharacterized protein n=1 Tax=Plasmodium inui San Antonio 1 TaxID=1237626 RepID=W6ZV50_9APIC|nr:hypothetical protein C922_04999 [Plasmodium inui San Antonio 1]EUD64652.1 hypothetical protein C922_04999 [Plasmodium inui San Antonio 1]
MKKNGWWGVFFGVLLFLIGASLENVINESNKPKSEEMSSSVNSYWGIKNESQYPGRKNKILQKHTLSPGEEGYWKDSTPSAKNGNGSGLFKKEALIQLRDSRFRRKPLRYAYIKSNGEDNLDRHLSSTEKEAENDHNESPNSFLQNMNVSNVGEILDYFEIVGETGERVSSLESYYVDIYTCKEIVRLINRQTLTNFSGNYRGDVEEEEIEDNDYNSGTTKDSRIQSLYDHMKLSMNSCLPQKDKLLNEINSLEHALTEGDKPVSQAKNSTTYKLLIKEYVNCLEKDSGNVKKQIEDVKKSIKEEYENKYCSSKCNSDVYFESVDVYLSYVNNNADTMYNSNISDAKEFLKSGTNIVSIMEKEIASENVISSIKFLQGEINNIINNYNYHIKNIKDAIDNIRKHKINDKSSASDKKWLVEKSFDLAKNMSLYKFNNRMFNRMKALYDLKTSKFKKLFIFLAGQLKDKLNSFAETEAFQENYNSIRIDCNFILDYAKDVYNRNLTKIKKYIGNESLKVIIVRNKVNQQLATWEGLVDKLEDLSNIIKSKYVIVMSAKSLIGELKSEFKTEQTGEYEFDGLITLMEKISIQISRVNEGVNTVYNTYSIAKDVETEIEKLETSIEGYMKEIDALKVKVSTDDDIEKEVVSKILFITENINNLKKILSLEEKAKANIAEIDELIMGTSLDMKEIIDKKRDAYNNIEMIIKDVYKDNLREFLKQMSLNMDKNINSINSSSSTDKLDGVFKNIKDYYEKMKSMKCDQISEHLQNITNLLKIISDTKEEILKIQYEDFNGKLTKSLEELQSVYDKLKLSTAEYTAEKGKIEEYKKVILKGEKEFFDKGYDKDDDMLELKSAYANFFKHKDNFLKKRSKVFEEFHIAKEALKTARIYLISYVYVPERYNIINEEANKKYNELIKEINNEDIDIKLEEYEIDFKRNNKLSDSIIKQVDQSNKNLCNLKILNRSIKDCSTDSNIIEELISKNNSLKEEIISERNEIEKDNFMDQRVKINLIIKLNNTHITLERKLYHNLTTLKTQIKKILHFYTSSKEKYKDLNETDLKKIKENEEWKSAKELIYALNVEYEILKKQADDLMSSKNSEIIKWIGNIIMDKDKKINKKVEEHVNSFDELIAKSKAPIFVRDINHYKYDENKQNARHFNAEVEGFVVKIEKEKEMLNIIRRSSNQYLEQANQRKSENIEFKAKEKAMKEVYEQIRGVSEQLNEALREIHTVTDLQKIELKIEKNGIHDMVNRITTEWEMSEHKMEEINSYKHVMDGMKKEKSEKEHPHLSLFVYTEFYGKAIRSHRTIKRLLNEASWLNWKCENSESISEIKYIKKQIDGYLRDILTNNSTLHEMLDHIKKMKEMMLDGNIQGIMHLVEKDVTETQKYSTLVKNEQAKSDGLIKELDKHFTDATRLKTEMNENLPLERIDEIVKKIMKYKDEIEHRKEEMNTYLKDSKEYRDNAFLYYHNAYSRNNRLKHLKERNEEAPLDIDMDKVSTCVNQCMTLANDAAESEEEIKKLGNSYVEYEGKMNSLLNDISVLQIRIMYAKGKGKATNIMNEIKQLHADIEGKLNESETKLEQWKKESQMNEKADILNNEESKMAYINVKLNLELIESNLLQIKDIKEIVNNILVKSNNLNSSILGASISEKDNSFDVLKREEMHYIQYLKDIESEKKLMTDEKSNVDVIHENILKIENELEKCKRNYEDGILEKAKEMADEKKKLIESTRESLNSLESYFTELFNESYLKEYDIKKKFIDYQKSMKGLYDEFEESYKVIKRNAANVAEATVEHNEARRLREEAEKAQININNKEEAAKRNLSEIKQHEFMNFLFHTKEYVDKIKHACEQENAQVGEGHADIERIIITIRKLTDEKSTFETFKLAEDKDNKLKKSSHQCNKNEAHNAFGKMIKASNFMGIKILTSSGFELSPEMHLGTISQPDSTLNFEWEVEIKSEKDAKLDPYKNLQVTYGYIKKIFKDSEETDRKKGEIEGWIRQGNNVCHNIKSSNELEAKYKYTKYRGSITLNKINDALRKYNQLDAMTCSIVNDNKIMESSEFTKLKELSDAYNKKKNEQVYKSEINKVNEEFQDIMKNVESLDNKFETVQKPESAGEIIIKENSVLTGINNKIDSINSRITTIMTSLNELLVAGMTCEKSSYASLIGNINAKALSDLRLINNQRENAEKYVEYIKKNLNLMNDDIRALNKYFDTNKINDYQSRNLEEVIKHANDLNEKEKETTGIVNDIKKESIDVNLEVEMNSLNSSKEKIMGHYNKLKDKIKSINDVYKNFNLVKLKEIESSSDKYLEIDEKFKNVLNTQITRLLDNHRMLEDIRKNITETEGKLKGINGIYTLQSIQNFNNVCKNIETNMEKLHVVEESNNSEKKQVEACVEDVSHLINRGNTLFTDLNDYDVVSNNAAKELTDDATQKYITKIKGKVNHTMEAFQKLLERIQENKSHIQKNEDINKDIYEIWKRANEIKARFSENCPENDNYFHVADYLKDIKNILNEIMEGVNIDAYIEKISHNIDKQIKDTQNHRSVESILKAKKNIESYNGEVNKTLQSMNTAQDKILLKKKDIDNIFSILSVNMKSSVCINTKKYINEVDVLLNKLNVDIHKLENFINDTKLRIKKLEDEEAKLKTENASRDEDDEPLGELAHDSENSQESNDNQNKRKRNDVSSDSKGDSSNTSLYKVDGLDENNNTAGNHFDENRKGESHNESNNSGGNNSGTSFRYAAGIILVFFNCSMAGFAIYTYKNDETEEAQFVTDREDLDWDECFNRREEEIIEVSLN